MSRTWVALATLLLAALACKLPSENPVATPTGPAALPTPTAPDSPLPTQTQPTAPESVSEPATATSIAQVEPTATTAAAPAPEDAFAVILVTEDDVLNVRGAPGVVNPIVDALDPHATGITQTGNRERIGDSMWVEINLPAGTGWVNSYYLTAQVPEAEFCGEPRVRGLIDKFVAAIQTENGEALLQLVSPKTGLIIRHEWWNPEVAFVGSNALSNLFVDSTVHDWGIQDGSGQPIQGSFKDVALPLLRDVVDGNYSRHCNTLETNVASGSTAGIVRWPFEYANVNYVALYRAAAPGDEFNWRTWAVGIEYVRGQPLIAFLVQYHWEI